MTDIAIDEEFGDELGELRTHARPWPRLWARLFDGLIYVVLLSIIVGLLFPNFVIAPVFQGDGGSMLLGVLLLPVAMAIDAVVVSVFGNSLGKWMVGTRIETIRHEKPDLATMLNRNLQLYFKGLGLGIPIVALIQYAINYSKVNSGGQTSWDEDSYTRIYDIDSNLARTCAVAAIVLALNIGGTVLQVMDAQRARQAPAGVVLVPERSRTDPVADRMEQIAAQIRPQQIDDITKLEGADANGRILTYRYAVSRREASDEQIRKFLDQTMVPNICKDKNMRSDMDNYAVTYRYHYTLPGNADPLVVDVTAQRCRALSAG